MGVDHLRFRHATVADAPSVVGLVECAYRGDASRVGWTTEADLLDGQRTDMDAVRELITTPQSRILLAERDGMLVGSLLLASAGDDAYLGMFAVRPDLQAAGIGRQMLAEAERIAREEMGAAGVRMNVFPQRTELIAWYERRGYTLTGERAQFPYGNTRFGLPKRDDLYFVVLRKALR